MSLDLERFDRYRDIIDDWDAFVAYQARPLRPTMWTNTLRLEPEELRRFLAEDGVGLEPLDWAPGAFRWLDDTSPGKHLAHPLGLYHIQEEVSMLPISFLDPRPGESVLDLCAAPGNKSVQAAVRMENRGRVLAVEINRRRLGMVVGTLERLGILNLAILNYDAGNLPRNLGQFDRVLADVPCSCEGTVRKNPEVLFRTYAPGFQANLQLAILRKAIHLARPGGRIVYSTCTYGPEENEAVVTEALEQAPEGSLRLVEARMPGLVTKPGLVEWKGEAFHPQMWKALRIYPHLNDTGGFFVAVLEKSTDAEPLEAAAGKPVAGEVDPAPYVEELAARFGIDRDELAELLIYRSSAKKLSMVRRDVLLPSRPEAHTVGIPFYRTKTRPPRLSTAASMIFGRRATKNVVDVDTEQVLEMIAERETRLRPEQAARCGSPGWVLPRYRGVIVPIAYFSPDEDGGGGLLRGSIPRVWKRVLDTATPNGEPPPENEAG